MKQAPSGMAIGPRRRSRSRSRARLRTSFASRAIPSINPLTSDPPDPPEIFSYRLGPVSIPRFVMHGGQGKGLFRLSFFLEAVRGSVLSWLIVQGGASGPITSRDPAKFFLSS